MSALTKPLIHPTTTIGGGGDAINIELVHSVSTVTSAAENVYLIVFSYGPDMVTTSWKYAASGARDTAFAAIKTLASTAI